jgi:hypothetical protein
MEQTLSAARQFRRPAAGGPAIIPEADKGCEKENRADLAVSVVDLGGYAPYVATGSARSRRQDLRGM